MTGKYCVVLGDVVDSAAIEDRVEFQQLLEATNEQVTETFEPFIHAPFAVIKGVDEIGGVLTSIRPIVQIQKVFARELHPVQLRLAVVVGEIDVNIDSREIAKMDGAAFARADQILTAMEKEKTTFRMQSGRPVVDSLISDEINVLDIVRSGWTRRQMDIVMKLDELGSQTEVARFYDVTPQAVSNALMDSNGKVLLLIEDRLDAAVGSVLGEKDE